MNAKEAKQAEKQKRREKYIGPDSKLVGILNKTGWAIILNTIWLVCCMPIVTIGPATTSFYYAMIKSIRKDRGYPVQEYISSFRRVFQKGFVISLFSAAWLYGLWYLQHNAARIGNDQSRLLRGVCLALMLITIVILIYLFPVLSRFTMKLGDMVKLSLVMAFRFFYFTIVIAIGSIALAWVWYYYLPMPTIFFMPALWCFGCTFMMEKVLRKYMPAPTEENANEWYYE